jgi:hypothetical protein
VSLVTTRRARQQLIEINANPEEMRDKIGKEE